MRQGSRLSPTQRHGIMSHSASACPKHRVRANMNSWFPALLQRPCSHFKHLVSPRIWFLNGSPDGLANNGMHKLDYSWELQCSSPDLHRVSLHHRP